MEVNVLSENSSHNFAFCESCYEEYIRSMNLPIVDLEQGNEEQFKFFQQILSELVSSMILKNGEEITLEGINLQDDNLPVCSHCGTGFAWIIQNGKFGCDHCYEEFRDSVDKILLQTQGSNEHKGRIPQRFEGIRTIQLEIKEKEEELNELVFEERYEEAAAIRDELRGLKDELIKANGEIDGK